jgi:hypothetical protein
MIAKAIFSVPNVRNRLPPSGEIAILPLPLANDFILLGKRFRGFLGGVGCGLGRSSQRVPQSGGDATH